MNRRARALLSSWIHLDLTERDSPTSTTSISSTAFLVLAAAALTWTSRVGGTAYAAAHLTLSAFLIGTAALADPENRSRTRADEVLVRTAPLTAFDRLAAIGLRHGTRVALLAVGAAIGPAVFLAGEPEIGIGGGLRYLVAALLLASAAVALASALQELAIRTLGRVRGSLATGVLRAIALGALFVGFVTCVGGLDGPRSELPLGGDWAAYLPPLWAGRFVADGSRIEDFLQVLLFVAVALGLAALTISRSDSVGLGRVDPLRGPLSRLEAWFLRGDRPARGLAAFLVAQMVRNPAFRSRVVPLVGLPIALMALGLDGNDERAAAAAAGVVASFPAVFLPLLAALFSNEDDADRAVFDSAPCDALTASRRAARVVLSVRLIWFAVLPLAAVLVATGMLPPLAAVATALFGGALGDLVAAQTATGLAEIPFTTGAEEDAPDLGGALTRGLIAAGLAIGFALVSTQPLAMLGALGLALWRLRSLSHP